MIFRTGSVLIIGNCDKTVLYNIYNFIKNILQNEYKNIVVLQEKSEQKQKVKKLRKIYYCHLSRYSSKLNLVINQINRVLGHNNIFTTNFIYFGNCTSIFFVTFN